MTPLKRKSLLYRITRKRPSITVGSKAFNLHRLIRAGMRVPETYAIPWSVYDSYLQDRQAAVESVKQHLVGVLDPARVYAVRSSANLEDSLEHSFAGQFKTVLGVQGELEIMAAITSVWDTANSASVQSYLKRLPLDKPALHMAVILQAMVQPVVSGVSFSRNPITGEDQIIVEAVQGEGTALVQEGATPLRWVKQSGQWKSCPSDSPLETRLIEQVVEQTRQIAARFKMPVDLEWVYDGRVLYWVQMREITALRNLTIYSNRIAKEVLPGMIKPLIWSINVPLINSIWIKLFTELVGKNDLKFDDLAKSFYYRSYFNLSALGRIWGKLGMPRESLEIVMGILPRPQEKSGFKPSWRMMRLVPRLLNFLINRLGFGKRFEQDYPRLSARLDQYHWQQASQLQEPELLGEINRLYDELQPFVYYNINIPLLMALYNALLGRRLKKAGVDPARFDLMAGMTEYLDLTPDRFLKDLQQEVAQLDPTLRAQISRTTYPEFLGLPGIPLVQNKVADFIQRFGHLSESGNDFSAIPWREKPETILKWIAQDPAASESVTGRLGFKNLELSGLNRRWAGWLYDRARKFRLYREQISSLYTYGYGLFRPYYLGLGAHFTRRGMLSNPEEIFYLHREEIEEIVAAITPTTSSPTGASLIKDYGSLARARQVEMLNCQEVQLPTLIYGDQAPLLDIQHQEKLTGVPTSGGYYTGPIKIVRGLEDFHKVQPGDILVIPFSDVGWTPLFARAGAVIAESGGILSHSSIIAREYQIPAVVSVPDAMRLPDRALVTVDGFRGEILLHKQLGE